MADAHDHCRGRNDKKPLICYQKLRQLQDEQALLCGWMGQYRKPFSGSLPTPLQGLDHGLGFKLGYFFHPLDENVAVVSPASGAMRQNRRQKWRCL